MTVSEERGTRGAVEIYAAAAGVVLLALLVFAVVALRLRIQAKRRRMREERDTLTAEQRAWLERF